MKIVKVSNWGDWYEFNGKEVKDGQKFHVQWPDGSSSLEALVYQQGQMPYSDHGHSHVGPNHKALFRIEAKGVVSLVPVDGLEVEDATLD